MIMFRAGIIFGVGLLVSRQAPAAPRPQKGLPESVARLERFSRKPLQTAGRSAKISRQTRKMFLAMPKPA